MNERERELWHTDHLDEEAEKPATTGRCKHPRGVQLYCPSHASNGKPTMVAWGMISGYKWCPDCGALHHHKGWDSPLGRGYK